MCWILQKHLLISRRKVVVLCKICQLSSCWVYGYLLRFASVVQCLEHGVFELPAGGVRCPDVRRNRGAVRLERKKTAGMTQGAGWRRRRRFRTVWCSARKAAPTQHRRAVSHSARACHSLLALRVADRECRRGNRSHHQLRLWTPSSRRDRGREDTEEVRLVVCSLKQWRHQRGQRIAHSAPRALVAAGGHYTAAQAVRSGLLECTQQKRKGGMDREDGQRSRR